MSAVCSPGPGQIGHVGPQRREQLHHRGSVEEAVEPFLEVALTHGDLQRVVAAADERPHGLDTGVSLQRLAEKASWLARTSCSSPRVMGET